MQLFEYKCSRCGKVFITTPPQGPRPMACVHCGGLKVYRVASPFDAIESLEEEAAEEHAPESTQAE